MEKKDSRLCSYCRKFKPRTEIVKTNGSAARCGNVICVSCWKEKYEVSEVSWDNPSGD